MNFKSITIQGFRTFIERQTFFISDIMDKSLNYVTGENLLEKSLEGNDVGKSSLFEALCFCLYGTTSTKLRAGDVANWTKSKKCFVQVSFEKNKINYILDRRWNPNRLILSEGTNFDYIHDSQYDVKDITQQELEDLIGLNFSGFLYSVFISQFTAQFFDLDPTDKLKVFSDMLRLEDWLDRSEKAKIKTKEINTKIESGMNEKYKLEGKSSVLNDQDYDVDLVRWRRENKEKVKLLENDHDSLKRILNKLLIDKKECETEISSLIKSLPMVKNKYMKSEQEKDKAVINRSKITNKIPILDSDRKNIKRTIDKFESVKDTCPYCAQKVSEKYLRDQLCELAIQMNKINSKLQVLCNNERLLLDKEDNAIKLYNKFYIEFSAVEDDLSDIKNELVVIKTKVSANQKSIDNLIANIIEIEKEVNPYAELKKKNIIEKDKVATLLSDIEKTLEGLHKEYSLYDFWVKGFKDVRLFVVAQALQEFEICINNNLQRLGLNEWMVKLSVEREVNKGKSIKRGFSVLVQSPYNDKFVSFKCWGGGVSQRLRLAGTMGLIDLIRSRTGIECNIEVWDEPSKFLSPRGIEDLINTLKDRSLAENKKIFLLDHRNLSANGAFNSIIYIEKRESGSCILRM